MKHVEKQLLHTVTTIEGDRLPLAAYRGLVVLVVVLATHDPHHGQLVELQQLYNDMLGRGLIIVGAPVSDFDTEPHSDAELRHLLRNRLNLSYPVTVKQRATEPGQAPLFADLCRADGFEGPVTGAFEKFLIDPDGYLVDRFAAGVSPLSAEVVDAIMDILPTMA